MGQIICNGAPGTPVTFHLFDVFVCLRGTQLLADIAGGLSTHLFEIRPDGGIVWRYMSQNRVCKLYNVGLHPAYVPFPPACFMFGQLLALFTATEYSGPPSPVAKAPIGLGRTPKSSALPGHGVTTL